MIVALHDSDEHTIDSYSICALGHDGKHTFGRVTAVFNPSNSKWSHSEPLSIHIAIYQTIACLYRQYRWGQASQLRRAGSLDRTPRVPSFMWVDLTRSAQDSSEDVDTEENTNIDSTNFKAYILRFIQKNRMSFGQAMERWLNNTYIPDVLTAEEVVCSFCNQETRIVRRKIQLLTRQGQYTILHQMRKCLKCQFIFKHSDIESGIIVFGSTAFTLGLMLQIDIHIKHVCIFQSVWK